MVLSRTQAANLANLTCRSRPGHCKSVQPTAKRLTTCNYDQLHCRWGLGSGTARGRTPDAEADQRLHPYGQAEGTARPTIEIQRLPGVTVVTPAAYLRAFPPWRAA